MEIHALLKKESTKYSQKTIGYTTGVFDLFHVGHLNILKKAKENCDYLIVGVSTDEVVPQKSMNKLEAWESLHFDAIFHGDDWKGSSMYNEIEQKLAEHGVDVVYLKYTDGISSTDLRKKINK